MGIFSESPEQDIEAISHIVGVSLSYYRAEARKQGISYTISTTSNFEQISTDGGRILKEFLYPTALQRVGTLLVLCNAYCPFSIVDGRKPVLNIHNRRELLSTFTCLLIQAALSTLTLERDGRTYSLQWHGFPDDYFRDQFFTYLNGLNRQRFHQAP